MRSGLILLRGLPRSGTCNLPYVAHCDECGSPATREFVPQLSVGRLFIGRTGGSEAPWLMCTRCWAEWLLFQARCGYDIHTHDPDMACAAPCLAKTSGRSAQNAALKSMVTLRDRVFFVQKTIDGLPGVNGSTPLAAQRVMHWGAALMRLNQQLYEYCGGLDDFLRQATEATRMRDLHYRHVDRYLLTFEAFASSRSAPNGDIQFPSASDTSIGLHCVAAERVADGRCTSGTHGVIVGVDADMALSRSTTFGPISEKR